MKIRRILICILTLSLHLLSAKVCQVFCWLFSLRCFVNKAFGLVTLQAKTGLTKGHYIGKTQTLRDRSTFHRFFIRQSKLLPWPCNDCFLYRFKSKQMASQALT